MNRKRKEKVKIVGLCLSVCELISVKLDLLKVVGRLQFCDIFSDFDLRSGPQGMN